MKCFVHTALVCITKYSKHVYTIYDIWCQNKAKYQQNNGMQICNNSEHKNGRKCYTEKFLIHNRTVRRWSVSTSLPFRTFVVTERTECNGNVNCEMWEASLTQPILRSLTHGKTYHFSGIFGENNQNNSETAQFDTLFSYSISLSDGMTYWLECCTSWLFRRLFTLLYRCALNKKCTQNIHHIILFHFLLPPRSPFFRHSLLLRLFGGWFCYYRFHVIPYSTSSLGWFTIFFFYLAMPP